MKKILVLLVAMILVIGTLSVPVFAQAENANEVKVVFSFINQGEVSVACEEISVGDANKDGSITVWDAIIVAHEKFCSSGAEGFKVEDGEYGPFITKMWGVETSNVSYMIDNAFAMSLNDAVTNGTYVCTYISTYDFSILNSLLTH